MVFYTARAALWYAHGRTRYTLQGYESHSKHFTEPSVVNSLKGHTVIVTGSNAGIGKSTAASFAEMGARVILACRDAKRAEDARAEIASLDKVQASGAEVVVELVDMSSLSSVRAFCARVLEAKRPIHVLVHNAGVMINEPKTTPEGLDANMACNVAGPTLMTELLEPAMVDGGRVIMVASGGLLTEKLEMSSLEAPAPNAKGYSGARAYSQNKRVQAYLSAIWSKRFPRLLFFTQHPGWVDTQAVRDSMPDFHKRMQGSLRTEPQGADTIVWLAVNGDLGKEHSGRFFFDRKEVRLHLSGAGTHSSPEKIEAMWNRLREILSLPPVTVKEGYEFAASLE
jgi:dehydrogenase/reductase SDR family protein 12